jgi:hypothetical protein
MDTNVRDVAMVVIKDYMGETTAQLYAKFYADKKEEQILDSLKELLREYLGDDKAKTIIISKGLGVA